MPATSLSPTDSFTLTASATGVRHAALDDQLEATGRSLCGTDTALPAGSSTDLRGVAVRLNDLHLDGVRPVCSKCRAAVNAAAVAGGLL